MLRTPSLLLKGSKRSVSSTTLLSFVNNNKQHLTHGNRFVVCTPSSSTLQQQVRSFSVSHRVSKVQDEQKTATTPEIEAPPEHVFEDTENTFKEQPSGLNIPILVTFWKRYFIRYIIITAIGLSVLYAVYWISDMFSSITFKNVAKWSFWTGVFLGAALVGGAAFAKQYFTISSRTVYKVALKRVLANQEVVTKLGTPIRPGKFRAYSYEYPDVSGDAHDVPLLRKAQFWKPAHMQMMFQILGSKGQQCMVSCEVSRKPGIWNLVNNNFKFHSLSVDIPDNEDRVVMKGTEEHAKTLHGQVSLK